MSQCPPQKIEEKENRGQTLHKKVQSVYELEVMNASHCFIYNWFHLENYANVGIS